MGTRFRELTDKVTVWRDWQDSVSDQLANLSRKVRELEKAIEKLKKEIK